MSGVSREIKLKSKDSIVYLIHFLNFDFKAEPAAPARNNFISKGRRVKILTVFLFHLL